MRVLTFLHSFEPGGVERIALRLVGRWRALGIDSPLVLGRVDGAMARDVGHGLDPRPVARPRPGAARFETLWMISMLPGAIRRERPDVLFCAGNTYAVVAVAMKLLLGRRCPPILAKVSNDLERRDMTWPVRLGYRLWLRIQGRYLDRVVAMAPPARAEIAHRLGVGEDRVTTIPDPALTLRMIATARSRPAVARDPGGGRRFVSVGRLVPQKNVALTLRAFQRGAARADRLTVIGDGPERDRLAALAARLGIADRVEFRGYAPAPIALLPGFDVLILSSDYEGVPAVMLEALAADLGIVATACSRSVVSILREHGLGALVPVGDERALAAAIAAARPNSGRPDLSRAQAERFTLDHAAERYVAEMARLARGRSAPPGRSTPASAQPEDRPRWRPQRRRTA